MSKYTTTVRYICESYAGLRESVGVDDIDTVIEGSVDKIFSWAMPETENEAEWNSLKKHILIHFYTREIGAETVGLWKLWLRQKWDGLFDYYDKLITSAKMEYDPLKAVEYTRSKNRDKDTKTNTENTAESKTSSTSNGETRDRYSATPQGALENIENGDYLTTYNYDTTNGESSSSGTSSGTSKFAETTGEVESETVSGRMNGKSPATLIAEYRKNLLKIEEMICHELEPLFFGLW